MRRWVALFILLSGAATAAPDRSLRPVERPGPQVVLEPSGTIATRPRDTAAQQAADRAQGPLQSLRPELRPRKFARIARESEELRQKGAVCGDPDIQGEAIGVVKGRIGGCGARNAVRVRSVSGVELSQTSVMTCDTAKALKTWVEDTAKPALSGRGGGLSRLRVAAHYICRTRNNQPGGRISEHGKARAIDISALRMRDGSLITVLNGWRGEDTGPILRRLHKGACGPFGTVLGPDSDRFHFDTASYRSGPFCR